MGATAIVFTEVKDKSGEWKALPLYREGYSGGLELCPVMDGYSDLYDFIKFAADYDIANDLSKEVSTVLRADRLADFKGECPSGGISEADIFSGCILTLPQVEAAAKKAGYHECGWVDDACWEEFCRTGMRDKDLLGETYTDSNLRAAATLAKNEDGEELVDVNAVLAHCHFRHWTVFDGEKRVAEEWLSNYHAQASMLFDTDFIDVRFVCFPSW